MKMELVKMESELECKKFTQSICCPHRAIAAEKSIMFSWICFVLEFKALERDFQKNGYYMAISSIADLFCTFLQQYYDEDYEFLNTIVTNHELQVDNCDKQAPFLWHWTTITYYTLWQMLPFRWFLYEEVTEKLVYLLQ